MQTLQHVLRETDTLAVDVCSSVETVPILVLELNGQLTTVLTLHVVVEGLKQTLNKNSVVYDSISCVNNVNDKKKH